MPLETLFLAALLFLAPGCTTPEPPPEPPPLITVPAPVDAAPIPVLLSPPTYGQQCIDDTDCPASPNSQRIGRCLCSEPLPAGGTPTTGYCWNGKVQTGRWWCTVQHGLAIRNGVIFP